jgi:hypothetical protein
VLVALAIRWIGSLFRHRAVLIFAVAWATISPAWLLLIRRLYHWHNFIGPVWRFPWPWSMVCIFGLSAAEDLLFIWTGVLICLLMLLSAFGTLRHWRIGRAFALSVAGLALAIACEFAIEWIIPAQSSTGHGVDWRTLTLLGVITNFGVWANIIRLPYLIGTACALWGAAPTKCTPSKLAE